MIKLLGFFSKMLLGLRNTNPDQDYLDAMNSLREAEEHRRMANVVEALLSDCFKGSKYNMPSPIDWKDTLSNNGFVYDAGKDKWVGLGGELDASTVAELFYKAQQQQYIAHNQYQYNTQYTQYGGATGATPYLTITGGGGGSGGNSGNTGWIGAGAGIGGTVGVTSVLPNTLLGATYRPPSPVEEPKMPEADFSLEEIEAAKDVIAELQGDGM